MLIHYRRSFASLNTYGDVYTEYPWKFLSVTWHDSTVRSTVSILSQFFTVLDDDGFRGTVVNEWGRYRTVRDDKKRYCHDDERWVTSASQYYLEALLAKFSGPGGGVRGRYIIFGPNFPISPNKNRTFLAIVGPQELENCLHAYFCMANQKK